MEKEILMEMQYLPESMKIEVLHFIGFLKQTYQEQKPATNERVFGRSKGRYQMSSDFDAPLEDFKEYM